ncbi:MAG: lytic transglycosylase domain-containing protein [Syntrophales bacterium]
MQDYRKRTCLGMLLMLCILWMPDRAAAATETVSLPITLEYPFIRSVLVHQLYTAAGERAIVVDEKQGDCIHIELSNPEVSRERSLIKVGNRIKIRAGVPVLGTCMGMFAWEGYIEVYLRLVLDEKSWQARFQTVDSRVSATDRKPVTIADTLWDLIKAHVHPYLDRATIELAPPLQEIKTFLPLVFLPEEQRNVQRWLDTLRPGPVQIEESAVKVDLLLEVQTLPKPPPSPGEVSPAEISRLSRAWEDWDALLVFEIESLIGQPISDGERATLLEILLENRHAFLQALAEKTIGPDLVRQQFIRTWQSLARILRKSLVNQKSRPPLSYLAFFTASDALVALDKLGPGLGLAISRDGLVRLARLLGTNGADPSLDYSYALNPALRTFLGFGPPLDDSGPRLNVQEIEFTEEPETDARADGHRSGLGRFLLPHAWAQSAAPRTVDQFRQWVTPPKNPERYIGTVRTLLREAADKILAVHPLAGDYDSFFPLLVSATAWQESCWRQFIVRDRKLRYLLSYNQTSVGLMQINERVWRGIYRVESLRWNIAYNVQAGTEILHHYLRDVTLREFKPANPADLDTVARVTYAVYNGGPGELKKYFARKKADRFYQSDRLFWEKYTAAKQADFDGLSRCLSGR